MLILRISTYKNADFVLSIRHPERLILSTQSGWFALGVRCVWQGKRRKEEKNRIEDKERDKKRAKISALRQTKQIDKREE